ncbi:MAG: hypothetical protein JRI68_18755 [Deltaproteobacteria bacterium]|nr:hypothetical protein [Deltaproteobacteria bacterium]
MTGDRTQKAVWVGLAGAVGLVAASSLASGSGCGINLRPGDGGGGAGGGTISSSGTGGGPPMEAGVGGTGGEQDDTKFVSSDQCPPPGGGRRNELFIGVPADLDGNTNGSGDDYSSFCGGGANGDREDVVYYVEAMGRGTLTLSAVSSVSQPVVYVESECGVRTTFGLPPDQLPCLDTAGQQIQLGVTTGQELYIIVEGDGSDGAYEVDLSLSGPDCGDGVINPANDAAQAEQCDPGPGGTGGSGGGAPAADGCDDICRFESPVGDEDKCPGIPATVGQPIQGHTLGFSDDYQPACAPAGGPDRLYFVALQQGEQLHLSVVADFDVVLAVMQECGELQPSHCQDSSGTSPRPTRTPTSSSSTATTGRAGGRSA